jgi:hypothetical protein
MKNKQRGFIVPLLLAIIVLLLIAGGIYYYHTQNINSAPTVIPQTTTDSGGNTVATTPNNQAANPGSDSGSTTTSPVTTTPPAPGLSTYDNFGISFQYPTQWGIPEETFRNNNDATADFNTGGSDGPGFTVSIGQDTDDQGVLLKETFDQMIARFRANDKYIVDEKDISANGVNGKELFYNNAVTNKPYLVEAYFPFQNNSYVTLSADYDSVSQAVFDSTLATVKWDAATAFKEDSATGMAVYANNGIRFEYPATLDTKYASLNLSTSVEKVGTAKLDSNGCYPVTDDSGAPSPSSVSTIHGLKFCSTTSSDVGAGQLGTNYTYTTIHNGNVYTVDYAVSTTNGCGAYDGTNYTDCVAAQKNFPTTVVKPIQNSIGTFAFTN